MTGTLRRLASSRPSVIKLLKNSEPTNLKVPARTSYETNSASGYACSGGLRLPELTLYDDHVLQLQYHYVQFLGPPPSPNLSSQYHRRARVAHLRTQDNVSPLHDRRRTRRDMHVILVVVGGGGGDAHDGFLWNA